jgi:hypothetical protein
MRHMEGPRPTYNGRGPFSMGKARLELARISPRDPKSRSSAHSDTSPSLWALYYQWPVLASKEPSSLCEVLLTLLWPEEEGEIVARLGRVAMQRESGELQEGLQALPVNISPT